MQRSLISAAVLSLIALAAAPAGAASKGHSAPATQQAPKDGTTTELPRNAYPTHYSISLKPDAANASFTGRVVIALQVTQPTSTLTLQALGLDFSAAQISAAKDRQPQAAKDIKVDAAKQNVTFEFAQPLPVGSYQLAVDYSGRIGTQASGLFYLDYEIAGAKKRALYTQFESADARRMFPSWDEPAFRATFALEATVPAAQMAISNMPVAESRDLGNGSKLVRFATTPRMSSYLLFFGLGEFERAVRKEGNTELGVVTVQGRLPQAQYALDSSTAVLREYNDYFGTPYPLPKLDNVAAPGSSQFFGAMENWGAIFTFESAILIDPAIASAGDRQSSFGIAAHEMAHQWFGDLVTMRWWDDLWLNEGFATWMAGRTTDKLHPEWQLHLNNVASNNGAIERDALSTTHPVVQHLKSAEETHAAFDEITYSKGAAVIRMLENYVGEAAWRQGVANYIKENKYGNAVSDQLWAQVEKAAHKPVKAIAHDFTLQPGVPLIRVESLSCKGGQTQVQLSQGEYSKDKPNKQALRWRVPVLSQTVGAKEPVRAVISNGKASMTLPGCAPALINAGQAGYYRVLYAPAAYQALAARFGQLAPVDQLGLMSDTWALGLAGLQPASDFLDLAQATPLDAPPQVWSKVAGVLDSLRYYAHGNPQRTAAVARFALQRLSPVMQRIGWDAKPDDGAPQVLLREQLIRTLGDFGDTAVVAEARRRYQAALAGDAKALPPELRRTVLYVVARQADAATWEQLHAAAKAEQSAIVKTEMYALLGAAMDPALAQRALALAISGEPAATDASHIISSVAEDNTELAFDFALANLERVNGILEPSSRGAFMARLASGSTEAATVGKLKAYADAHVAAAGRAPVNTAVSRIEFRVEAIRSRMPAVDAWLAAHSGGASPK